MELVERSPEYIRAIAPYQPGKPISELAREMGLDEGSIVKLASNENPLGLSPAAKAAIEHALSDLARCIRVKGGLVTPLWRVARMPRHRQWLQ